MVRSMAIFTAFITSILNIIFVMSKKYELLLVLPGTLDEKEAAKQINEIKESLGTNAQDVELNNLGKVRLAYPIKQIRYGYYYTLVFSAEPEAVKAISDRLKLRADILRSMITLFNTNVTATKKIMYTTNEVGVTTMMEKEEGAQSVQKAAYVAKEKEESKVDLKDIDEKLNAILENENIIPGV